MFSQAVTGACSALAATSVPDVIDCIDLKKSIAKTSRTSLGLIKLMGNPITVVAVTPEFDLWLVRVAAGSWEIKVI